MAKKNKKKAAKKSADKQFEARLLETSADQVEKVLAEVGDDAEALVLAWAKSDNTDAVIAAFHSENLPKSVVKAARRGAQILKSRGALDQIPQKKSSRPVVSANDEVVYEAWLLPPDGSGVSMLTIASHREGSAYEVADFRIHDVAGIIEMRAGGATRSSIRKAFSSNKEKFGLEPAPVPVEWARWRVAKAKEDNQRSGTILPLGFDRAADLLQPVPEKEPTHPVEAAELKVSEDEIDERAARSGALHHEPEFFSWLPNVEVMNELLAKVGSRLGNPPTQDESVVNGIIAEEVVATTDRLFTPELRARIAELMHDSVISLLYRGKKELALDTLATAEAARRAGLITSPPSDIPFFKVFVEKGITALAVNNEGRLNIPIPKPKEGVLQAPPEVFEAAKGNMEQNDAETDEAEGTDSAAVEEAPATDA